MGAASSRRGGANPPAPRMRQHDADGVSREASAVIGRHGLDRTRVLGWADHYGAERGTDFNLAPADDFEYAPLGINLARMAYKTPAFGPFRKGFDYALHAFDYATSDGIMDECLRRGIIKQGGRSIHGSWMRYAEQLEGLNASLFRATLGATKLRRFILDFGELDNYRHGRWRRDGDAQDRVSTTVGASNFLLGKMAVAIVTYDAGAIEGWMQAVRYSPYPRHPDTALEWFGCEKDGRFAGEGEVHVHTGCPIPPRRHIKITILPPSKHGRGHVVERYGDVAIVG